MDLELCISQGLPLLPASNDKLHFSQWHTELQERLAQGSALCQVLADFLTHLGAVIRAPPLRVTIARHLLQGWNCGPVLSEQGTRKLLHLLFGHLAATQDGIILPLNAGIPKWLGIWPNDKAGHFVNSCLLAHKLKKENWGESTKCHL